MAAPHALFLHEEIMLLALRDEEGTIAPGTMYQYAIAGAILSELLLHERVRMQESRRKQLVDVVHTEPIGDPLIDECLLKIQDTKRRATLQTWVTRFARMTKLSHRVAAQLCRRRILRADEGSYLLVFTRKIYPALDPKPERKLKERLRTAVFTDTRDLDPRTIVLVSLANSADLLKVVFDKKELRSRKKRIEQVVSGEATGKAAREAIEAMRAAVMVACIMPGILAATVTH